eukprot:1011871-Rhodomonas_salina.2
MICLATGTSAPGFSTRWWKTEHDWRTWVEVKRQRNTRPQLTFLFRTDTWQPVLRAEPEPLVDVPLRQCLRSTLGLGASRCLGAGPSASDEEPEASLRGDTT